MVARSLSFWFDFASSYSYLSAFRIEALARERDIDVVWRPFLLGPIFVAQGWTSSPFNLYPLKGAYMYRDMERQTKARGLGFGMPDPFPQNSLTAARVALAVLADHPTDKGPAFCRAVYGAEFAEGRDISRPETLRLALTKAGLDPDLVERAADPAVKQALKDVGDEAANLKLFGAPSFIVGDELFWGDDRLEHALDWAAG